MQRRAQGKTVLSVERSEGKPQKCHLIANDTPAGISVRCAAYCNLAKPWLLTKTV